ncbi:MAG: hypothetical protein ACRD4O_03815, partial [Bryobacteraceae bacterium]
MYPLLLAVFSICLLTGSACAAQSEPVTWGREVQIADPPTYSIAGFDARRIHPGVFGGDYPRALRLTDGSWLCTYTG